MKTSKPAPKPKPPSSKTVKAPAHWPARLLRLGVLPATKAEQAAPGWLLRKREETRAVMRTARLAVVAEERTRLEAIDAAKPRCPLCNQKLNPMGLCAPCEEMKAMSYSIGVGGAYQITKYRVGTSHPNGEVGKVVELDAKITKRCRYVGDMMLINGTVCALFTDDKTGLHYAQPAQRGA